MGALFSSVCHGGSSADDVGTIRSASSQAFSQPFSELTPEQLARHIKGDAGFEAAFVSSPAAVNPGLGPHFNNTSCFNCHVNDGRGRPDKLGGPRSSFVLRLSLDTASTGNHSPVPVPNYGLQLTDRAVRGVVPEGKPMVTYEEFDVMYHDGATARLRRPRYEILEPRWPLPENLQTSPRVAPPVFGVGLLESIAENSILAHADLEDRDRDGISGKPQIVIDPIDGTRKLGRFGWKASAPSLVVQTASAYFNDMGITTKLFNETHPDDPHPTDGPEISWETVEDVAFYVRTLAAPQSRMRDEEEFYRGKALFIQVGCVACHIPELMTGEVDEFPWLSNRPVRAYSDLLLHDMGEGLADGRPDGEADGQEWRTAPLWGIGLTRIVGGHFQLLHDGRARNVEEAVLWHGGEAEAAREAFKQLDQGQRRQVLNFVESL
jgi:CxxC motif-containing protein (DUF1111 family)